jgi:hypothetical protein
LIIQNSHEEKPSAFSGSLEGQVWAKEYCVTSNPGAEMSKCTLFPEQLGFSGGHKFAALRTRVVSTVDVPGMLLVPVSL